MRPGGVTKHIVRIWIPNDPVGSNDDFNRQYPTIRPNCTVLQLQFRGKRATGALVESSGETFADEEDEILLSARAIGSPYFNKMKSQVLIKRGLVEEGQPLLRRSKTQ